MVALKPSDLKLTYHRNNFKSEVDCSGYADFEYFNKFQRQPIANLINVYAMEYDICDDAYCETIEIFIRKYLPENISTYVVALNWLLENLIYETIIKSDT